MSTIQVFRVDVPLNLQSVIVGKPQVVETTSLTITLPQTEEPPVSIVNGKMDINPSVMAIGQMYSIEHDKKRYLVEKVREGVLRVYEVKR